MKNIICTKQGMWKFYHDSNLGICFYGPRNDTPLILFDKGAKDFDVTCDDKGCIYLLCQDDKNNIYMFYYDRTSWRRRCILESKSAVPYDKNFSLIVKNGWINAFYTICHSDRTLLIHHILNSDNQPKVIETSEKPITYTITSDLNDNIYCIYQKDSIGFQVFKWNTKTWQNFSPIHTLPGDLSSVCAVCDRGTGLHIACCMRVRNEHAVYYVSRNGAEKIADGFTRNPEPVILSADKFYILLKTDGRLVQCVAENPDEGFSRPSYYFPGSFSTHSVFKLSSSADLRVHNVFAETVYGTEPHPRAFEAAIIQDALDKIDYSLPSMPAVKAPDIETFVANSEPFVENK